MADLISRDVVIDKAEYDGNFRLVVPVETIIAVPSVNAVVLPCQVGTYLWIDSRKALVEEFFGYETERYLHCQFYDNLQYIDIPFEEVGKTVFLTPEETKTTLERNVANG